MVDDATATSSCMWFLACGCEKRGKSLCLGGQFGSHVIKTINIVGEALVRGMSSRFVMGWNKIHVAYFIQTHSVSVSYMQSNLNCLLHSVKISKVTCIKKERYIRMVGYTGSP